MLNKVSARLDPVLGKALADHLKSDPSLTATEVVVKALTAYLEVPPPDADLREAISRLESRLEVLESTVESIRATPSKPRQSKASRASQQQAPSHQQQGEGLTDRDVANALGLALGSLRNAVSRLEVGSSYKGFRIVSRQSPPTGGPPRRLWESIQ